MREPVPKYADVDLTVACVALILVIARFIVGIYTLHLEAIEDIDVSKSLVPGAIEV